MTTHVVVGGVSPSPAGATRGFLRWVCTSNPFYVISAGLFLAGLFLSFAAQAHTWALMSGLAGYTLLLAGTACLLVRFAQAWDDLRTVLLLVVLMFLATSVTFDEVLVLEPAKGMMCNLVGFGLAVLVSEGVMHGIRLRLPLGFRLPYYLVLGLFFLYPLVLSSWISQPHSEAMQWGLFSFSAVGALAFLTLIPAIRQGPMYVQNSGSPWVWPWFPWALFVLLALAVPARAVLMCWSLHVLDVREGTSSIFGLFFLVPFGMAAGLLLLEVGLVHRRRPGMDWRANVVFALAMTFPWLCVGLSQWGHRDDHVYQRFLAVFMERWGASPLFLTLLASASFYAWACWRRAPGALDCFCAVLLALGLTKVDSQRWPGLALTYPGPLLAAAALQLSFGILRRNSGRVFLGLGAALIVARWFLPHFNEGQASSDLISVHIALLAALAVGAWFEDLLAQCVRGLAVATIFLLCLSLMFAPLPGNSPEGPWILELYPLAMALLLGVYGWSIRHVPSMSCAVMIATVWIATVMWRGYLALRHLVTGLDYLALSLTIFGLAVAISLAKGRKSRKPASE